MTIFAAEQKQNMRQSIIFNTERTDLYSFRQNSSKKKKYIDTENI